jgi:vacuolar-type H+-ATPase subunit I/STV1
MIVRMKKVSLVVQLSAKEKALNALGNAKVFHTGRMEGHSEKLEDLKAEYERINHCSATLPPKILLKESTTYTANELVTKMNKVTTSLKEIESSLTDHRKELSRIGYWPKVSLEDIDFLMKQGLFIRLYEVQKSDFKSFNKIEEAVFVIGKGIGTYLVAVVTTSPEKFPTLPYFVLPKQSVDELNQTIVTELGRQKKLNEEFNQLATESVCFGTRMTQLDNDIAFEKTLSAINADEELAVIEGYIPVSELDSFKQLAAKES